MSMASPPGDRAAPGPASSKPAVPETVEALASALTAYCRQRLPQARALHVSGLQRIFGGASRQTWRFVLHQDGMVQPLILRRDPEASLIETERRIEFSAYQRFADTAVPVPRVWWLEEDPGPLGHPFFVMEEITGCEAGPLKLMAEPYRSHHEALAAQKWTILGQLSATPPRELAQVLPAVAPERVWRRELDHWQAVIERDAVQAQPVLWAALRWLRAHPPPPPRQLAVVHGDYRTGNLLVDRQGRIRAVLDWEMMHLGDPLEDLAWGMNRAWCFQRDERVGGLARREQAIAWWEAASGLRAEAQALHWWELFNAVKAQAIWLSAARTFEDGGNRDLMMVLAAWSLINTEDRALLDLMGRLR